MSDEPEAPDEPTRGPSLPGQQEAAIRSVLAGIHTNNICRVVRYDAEKGLVDVKILIMDFHTNEEGARVPESYPVITNLPVAFYSAGGFSVLPPIVAGDSGTTGRIAFLERSSDRWLAGTGQEVDPAFYHRFHHADAVFEIGVRPFGNPIPNVPTDHLTIGADGPDDGSHAKIHFRASTITVGPESGSKAMGLDGDSVDCGTLTITSMTVVGPAVTVVLGQYIDAFGAATPIIPGNLLGLPIPIKGKLAASAIVGKSK